MKILCSISSVEYTCEHFPGSLYSRESYHPVFDIPQRKLFTYLPKWANGELTDTDSYLLFLAFLKSTDRVHFRLPVFRSERTSSIVFQNMESLVRVLSRLNAISSPSFHAPEFVISTETRLLDNVQHWIESWNTAYLDFQSGNPSAHDSRKLIIREAALERMIKNPHKPVSSYGPQIADWAAAAGSFPVFMTVNPYANRSSKLLPEKITCSDYWKSIIIKCASLDSSIYAIDRKDIVEILEHCEENIPASSLGTIYSNALFSILRKALEKQKNFLGLGDIDVSNAGYSFLGTDDTAESANMKAMIAAAPLEEPMPSQYKTKLDYLRAKMRWEMAQASVAALPDSAE